MGAMLRQVIDRFDVVAYPIVALIVFVAVFAIVAFRAATGRKEDIERLAGLPLSDGKES